MTPKVHGVCWPDSLLSYHGSKRSGPMRRIGDERKVQTSETLIQVAMIRPLLTRLGRSTCSISTHSKRALA